MEIKTVETQRTLKIRVTTPMEKIADEMGKAFGEIAEYMGRKGIDYAGMPYAMYYNMDMEALDVEMGFPVSGKYEGEGRVKAGEIPGGKIASAIHNGPYARLEETYNALMAFVKDKGENPKEWMYEYYLNSPMEVKEEELRTEICYPLK